MHLETLGMLLNFFKDKQNEDFCLNCIQFEEE